MNAPRDWTHGTIESMTPGELLVRSAETSDIEGMDDYDFDALRGQVLEFLRTRDPGQNWEQLLREVEAETPKVIPHLLMRIADMFHLDLPLKVSVPVRTDPVCDALNMLGKRQSELLAGAPIKPLSF